MVLEQVLATADDVAKLKADHPRAEIEWTEPDAAVSEKMKAAFKDAIGRGRRRRIKNV